MDAECVPIIFQCVGTTHRECLCLFELVLPKFSSVRFSPHFLRTENQTDRIFSELNRTRIELVRTGSNRRTGEQDDMRRKGCSDGLYPNFLAFLKVNLAMRREVSIERVR